MAEREDSRLPEAFAERPNSIRIVLVVVVPTVFGAIAGAMLSPLPVFYIALQVIALVGGIYAGLEHRMVSEATVRGLMAGLCFGTAILVTHLLLAGIQGGDDHRFLGDDPLLLPFITAVFGALLGVIGSLIRRRAEGRASSS